MRLTRREFARISAMAGGAMMLPWRFVRKVRAQIPGGSLPPGAVNKYVLPLVKRNPSTRLGLIVARTSIPACGIVAIAIALEFQYVYNLILDANILGMAAIIVPYICGMWWSKANRRRSMRFEMGKRCRSTRAWRRRSYRCP